MLIALERGFFQVTPISEHMKSIHLIHPLMLVSSNRSYDHFSSFAEAPKLTVFFGLVRICAARGLLVLRAYSNERKFRSLAPFSRVT